MKYKITYILRRSSIDDKLGCIYEDKKVIICFSEADAWDITTRLREYYGNILSELTVEEVEE